jgi:hypothetical protein
MKKERITKEEIAVLKAAYDKLVDELETLLEGREIDAIIPALTVTLGVVLAHSGRDKTASIKYVVNSVISVFEEHAEEEE